VAALLRRGHQPTVFDNLSTGDRRNLKSDVPFVEGDIRDPHALIRALQGADVAYHLAASVGNKRGLENPTNDASVNAIGTINVLEAARIARCRKIVYSSSAAIYGETVQLPVDEDQPKRPLTPYAISKLAGENYVLAYSALYDIEGICLRYFNVYGEGQRFDAYGNVIPIFVTNALEGRTLTIYGDGEQTRDFVNVADVAEANVRAGETSGVSGAFNVGSGAATTINEVATLIVDSCPTKVPVVHGPPRAGDVRHSRADISSAIGALGYRPSVQLQPGLNSYVEWARTGARNAPD
jgi:UDP-glucose 4-epimerase